jgi:UPF0271 protein
MEKRVNLNADIAEGWGAYEIGNDDAMMEIVKSANVACGFHGGDANTMYRIVMKAKERGVSIGAHPGFNDLWGFGRRPIRMNAAELEHMIAYQIGALQAMAAYGGLRVTHVKAHGALSNMAATDESYAMAIGRAIKTVDPAMIYVALTGSQMHFAAERLGLKVAREGYCDRRYADDGMLASRAIPGAVLKDAREACEQTLGMVLRGEVVSVSGKTVKVEVDTLCVHGDEATGVNVAAEVRKALEASGVRVIPLPEIVI